MGTNSLHVPPLPATPLSPEEKIMVVPISPSFMYSLQVRCSTEMSEEERDSSDPQEVLITDVRGVPPQVGQLVVSIASKKEASDPSW